MSYPLCPSERVSLLHSENILQNAGYVLAGAILRERRQRYNRLLHGCRRRGVRPILGPFLQRYQDVRTLSPNVSDFLL